MRIPVITGSVALCAGIVIGAQILTVPKRASAQSETVAILTLTSDSPTEEQTSDNTNNDVVEVAVNSVIDSSDKKDEIEEDKELIHTVKKGESLDAIAKQYEIEDWKRIFYKNTNIENPDHIDVDQKLIIPKNDEELTERDLPAPPAPEPIAAPVSTNRQSSTRTQSRATSSRATQPRTTSQTAPKPQKPSRPANTSGNLYSYGYCTWHVKNLRPDLPNNLGNANTWFTRAAAQGYATGYSPRVGAVAEATSGYMHVAYVTAVHGDGTVTVSEMNFKGWNVVSTRRADASQFRYIY